MKRYLLISIACFIAAAYTFSTMGCMSANQLAAEKAFYEAKIALTKQTQSQPIFEILASDLRQPIILQNVSAIRVFQMPAGGSNERMTQYVQKDYAAPYLQLTGSIIGAALPWFGAFKIVEAVAGIPRGGNTTMNVAGDGNKSVMGDFQFSANNNSGAMAMPGTMALINDQTATPTVVDPVVVVVPPSYPPEPVVP